ncbi:IS4/Tn5 family transposase DNA-binding protein [Burkholderia pseudomallei]|uniref:IS4/Tn5 family transposase DNA-binding protein n=1 Tax=Burkholderia pseudomallei TaxID=28450 RepID=UPI0009B2323B
MKLRRPTPSQAIRRNAVDERLCASRLSRFLRERLGSGSTALDRNRFAHLDLGDARYNKRARTLVERLAAKPTVGVPQTRCCA